MSDMTPEVRELLENLQEKHGEIAAFPTPDGEVIVLAKPAEVAVAFARLQAAGAGPAHALPGEIKSYVLAFVVYPEKPEAKRILEKWPAMIGNLASAANRLAGSGCAELSLGKD